MKRILECLAAVVLVGCAGQPSPIVLQGEPASIRALAGQWEGEYWSNGSDRRGVITFSLAAGTDSAYGDVLMFAPLGQPIRSADRADEHRTHVRVPQALRIEFVRVGFGSVAGMLEPYVGPDCDCTVTTRFTGALVADTIRGTFITRGDHGGSNDGNWRMTRKSSIAERQ
ncbi:MAG: hypothetical protein ABI625_15195 [bacterium]